MNQESPLHKFPVKRLFGNLIKRNIIKRGEGLVKYLNEVSNWYTNIMNCSKTVQNPYFIQFIKEQQKNVQVEDLLREEDFHLDDWSAIHDYLIYYYL